MHVFRYFPFSYTKVPFYLHYSILWCFYLTINLYYGQILQLNCIPWCDSIQVSLTSPFWVDTWALRKASLPLLPTLLQWRPLSIVILYKSRHALRINRINSNEIKGHEHLWFWSMLPTAPRQDCAILHLLPQWTRLWQRNNPFEHFHCLFC